MYYIHCLFIRKCMCIMAHAHVYVRRKTRRNWFSLSAIWIPGVKLRSSGLVISAHLTGPLRSFNSCSYPPCPFTLTAMTRCPQVALPFPSVLSWLSLSSHCELCLGLVPRFPSHSPISLFGSLPLSFWAKCSLQLLLPGQLCWTPYALRILKP